MRKEKGNIPQYIKNGPKRFKFLEEAYRPEQGSKGPKSLGEMNGWKPGEYPSEYIKCVGLKHVITEECSSPTYKKCTCIQCNISWSVDSSG